MNVQSKKQKSDIIITETLKLKTVIEKKRTKNKK